MANESQKQQQSEGVQSSSDAKNENKKLYKGKCKWFNVAKGWGFITPDDGTQDVFVHQSVIQMPGFRSLGENEEIEFDYKETDKGLEATLVTGPSQSECKGSNRRLMSKKRFRRIRCYNCGEFASHIAAKCHLSPQPKRCHQCKSEDHLIADCPNRQKDKNKTTEDDQEPTSAATASSPAAAAAAAASSSAASDSKNADSSATASDVTKKMSNLAI